MKSIRSKFTLFTVVAIIISVIATGLISIYFIRGDAIRTTGSLLTLTSENRQETLNEYLNSIELSIETISNYAEDDLRELGGVSEEQLEQNLAHVEPLFDSVSGNTNGVYTYYYRIAPELTKEDTGFWYVRENGEDSDFTKEELTHLQDYDKDDVSHVGWYTIPKEAGHPLWLDPYMNENLGVEMISYVAPIKYENTFVGVIGIDFGYDNLIRQMEDIMAYETGYAFLVSDNDEILYHPTLEPGTPVEEISSKLTAEGLTEESGIIAFEYDGVPQHCACRALSNGMRLYVAAPDSEMNDGWENLTYIILLSTLAILILFAVLTTIFVRRITDPLDNLTAAARRLDRGDYDVELSYEGEDEVGLLTRAFRQMVDHLNAYEGDPNDMFQKDPLTSVRNRTAFDLYMGKMDDRIQTLGTKPQFAVCVFRCDNVREVNEKYGHEKGDITLKTACMLACKVFKHSSVFRIGGDIFAAVLQQDDYEHRDELWKTFRAVQEKTNKIAPNPWQKMDLSCGIAVFDPQVDNGMEEVLQRAETMMDAEIPGQEEADAGNNKTDDRFGNGDGSNVGAGETKE